ncbi:MAG: hypothetical protein HZB61_07785 [Nitrospirae bacterium]|nr:hypothetical protein [Nitrospirota bacterium]
MKVEISGLKRACMVFQSMAGERNVKSINQLDCYGFLSVEGKSIHDVRMLEY